MMCSYEKVKKLGVIMTGNVSVVPQILGASTVGGVAIATLPETGSNSIFSAILIGVIIVAAAVVVSRLVKLLAQRTN